MPANTTRNSLPYPVGTDPVNQIDDTLKLMADAVDEKLFVTRSAATGLKYGKNLAVWEESSPNLTGWVVIQTNLTVGNYMMKFDLRGYTYWAFSNIIDLSITGYGFQTDNTFYSVDVNNRGSMNFTSIQLMVRNSDGKVAIALRPDTSNQYWQYPKMAVDAFVGHTEPTNAMMQGWTISRVSSLTGYTVKVNADQSYWRSMSLTAPAVNYGDTWQTARYRKQGQTVYLQGLIKSSAHGSVFFTLPEGFRPNGKLIFSTQTDTGVGRMDVDSNGWVMTNGGGTAYVSLSGIQFPAER